MEFNEQSAKNVMAVQSANTTASNTIVLIAVDPPYVLTRNASTTVKSVANHLKLRNTPRQFCLEAVLFLLL
jgi:hypothetical protein